MINEGQLWTVRWVMRSGEVVMPNCGDRKLGDLCRRALSCNTRVFFLSFCLLFPLISSESFELNWRNIYRWLSSFFVEKCSTIFPESGSQFFQLKTMTEVWPPKNRDVDVSILSLLFWLLVLMVNKGLITGYDPLKKLFFVSFKLLWYPVIVYHWILLPKWRKVSRYQFSVCITEMALVM